MCLYTALSEVLLQSIHERANPASVQDEQGKERKEAQSGKKERRKRGGPGRSTSGGKDGKTKERGWSGHGAGGSWRVQEGPGRSNKVRTREREKGSGWARLQTTFQSCSSGQSSAKSVHRTASPVLDVKRVRTSKEGLGGL